MCHVNDGEKHHDGFLFCRELLLLSVSSNGKRSAMVAAKTRNEHTLRVGEAGQIRIGDHVPGMLVTVDIADEVADIMQIGTCFQ